MEMRNSPLSQTPTKTLPIIPGVTLDDNGKIIEEDEESLKQDLNKVGEEKAVPMQEQNGTRHGKLQGISLI